MYVNHQEGVLRVHIPSFHRHCLGLNLTLVSEANLFPQKIKAYLAIDCGNRKQKQSSSTKW